MVNEYTSSSIDSLQAAARQATGQPVDQLFTQDLASAQALTIHLPFEVDGSHRDVALGICRTLDLYEVPEPK